VDATRVAFERMRRVCEAEGRDPATLDLSVTLTTVCGVDATEIERRGAVSPAQYEMADLSGSPAQVVDQLAAFAETGATRAYLRILDLHDVDHIALLGEEVLSAVIGT
jgi:alkanesulfonate monooxygenase SsuD/methylene tetrahydromethanopterin reductase-like flavin-dependent oxidoreductase (luciferase family)